MHMAEYEFGITGSYSCMADEIKRSVQVSFSTHHHSPTNAINTNETMNGQLDGSIGQAEQGNPSGQCSLGICYETGKGVEQDEAQAAALYYLAAEQGHARAQYNLGVCLRDGKGEVQK